MNQEMLHNMNGINLSRMLETISGRWPLQITPQDTGDVRVILTMGEAVRMVITWIDHRDHPRIHAEQGFAKW
jgi:hypothetical protein